jgi:hypothetical protein
MDGKKTRLGDDVGEATRSHNLHSGGAGKWFLVSGPQLSSPAIMKINTNYFILWLCYVLWLIYGCNAESSWFCAQLHLANMWIVQFTYMPGFDLFYFGLSPPLRELNLLQTSRAFRHHSLIGSIWAWSFCHVNATLIDFQEPEALEAEG